MSRDYYQVLGVARGAQPDEIKKAYRSLAKKFHPDVNKDDKSAEDRFKEISAAYDVLSDPKKRQQYDLLGHAFAEGGGAGQGPWNSPGGGGFHWGAGQSAGGDGQFDGLGDIFSELFGMGGVGGRGKRRGAGPQPPPRAAAKGQDLRGAVDIDFLEALRGTTAEFALQRDHSSEKISVKIPPGVTAGQQLRVAGKGGASPQGGPAGDLFIEVRIRASDRYWREGNDLLTNLPITFYESILGGKIELQTPDGTTKLTIPPHTASGQKFRLKGKGAPIVGKPGTRGDFYALIQIVPPPTPNDATRALAEQWAREHPYNPRQ